MDTLDTEVTKIQQETGGDSQGSDGTVDPGVTARKPCLSQIRSLPVLRLIVRSSKE
jgi:hypothetical protein